MTFQVFHDLYEPCRIITSNHITRHRTTTKTPELADSCFLVAAALRAPACRRFFTESRCVTHISTSSVLRRVFYIFWVQVSALLLSFLNAFLYNSTRREVWAAGKAMLSVVKAFSRHIKCPVKSVDFATIFGTSLFQPQSNLPDFPRWRHIKNQNTSYLPSPGDRSLIRSPSMPLLSPPGPGGWGFQLTSALLRLLLTEVS